MKYSDCPKAIIKNEEVICRMLFAPKNQPCVKDACGFTMSYFVDEDEDWEKDELLAEGELK